MNTTLADRTPTDDPTDIPGSPTARDPRTGDPSQEVTPMQLDMQQRDPQPGDLIGAAGMAGVALAAADARAEIPCLVEDPELWFAEKPDDVEFAKSLCGTCPERIGCLTGALERQEPWGVWGGQLFVAGVVVARKRPRGRPRKDSVAA